MRERRVSGHRCADRSRHTQRLVGDIDLLAGVFRVVAAIGDHHGDRLSHVRHFAAERLLRHCRQGRVREQ